MLTFSWALPTSPEEKIVSEVRSLDQWFLQTLTIVYDKKNLKHSLLQSNVVQTLSLSLTHTHKHTHSHLILNVWYNKTYTHFEIFYSVPFCSPWFHFQKCLNTLRSVDSPGRQWPTIWKQQAWPWLALAGPTPGGSRSAGYQPRVSLLRAHSPPWRCGRGSCTVCFWAHAGLASSLAPLPA